MNVKAVLASFVLTLAFVSAKAQDNWSLQRCIDYAQTNNLSIRQGSLSIDQQYIDLRQQKMNQYPSVNGTASHNYNFGRTIDPFTNQFVNQSIQSNSFGVNAGMTLFNGMRIQNNIKQSESVLAERQLNQQVLQNNIALQVADAYLQILFNIEQLNIAELQKSTTEGQLELSKKLFKSGKTDKTDVLNQEAQLASNKYDIVVAKNNIDIAKLNLKQILQLEVNTPFEIDVPAIAPQKYIADYELTVLIDTALATFPEIKQAEQALLTAHLSQRIAQGGYYPTLRMFANMNTVYTQSNKERFNEQTVLVPIGTVEGSGESVLSEITRFDTRTTSFGDQITSNFGQSVGVSLSVPIFNNYQVRNSVSMSEISYNIRAIELQQAKTQLINDVTQAYTTYKSAVEQFRSAQANYDAQVESFELNNKRYESGLMTAAEILLFQNNKNTAEINLNRAIYQLVFSKTQLDFYLGKPLSVQ